MTYLIDHLEQFLAILAILGMLASAVGAVLPPQWKFTQFLARFSADIRAIRQNPPIPGVVTLVDGAEKPPTLPPPADPAKPEEPKP